MSAVTAGSVAPADSGQQTRHKRLSMSEILAMTLAKGAAKRSSVTLTRSASGDVQIEVVVSTDDHSVMTIEDAETMAQIVFDRLTVSYPHAADREQASVALSRNAKGETQVEVSARTGSQTTRTLETLTDVVVTTYDKVRARFPMANGTSAKPGSVA